jgi:hypothetical protein
MTRRLRIRLTLLVAFAVLQAASSAGAQSTYSCRDRNGHTLTSDRPIADCAGVMRELTPSGVLRREIAPPLTAEQQRQKEADDRVKRTADEAAREQHRRDMALLTAYQNEDQIEAARKRALSDASESIRASHERLAELEKEKKAFEQDAEAYKGKAVPPLFKRKVDDNQALIDDEQAAIKQRQVDVERVNQRYDEDKRRYRELSTAKK